MARSGRWSEAWPYDDIIVMGSFDSRETTADGIVDSGDANGSHRLLIIKADGIVRLTYNRTLARLIQGHKIPMVSQGQIIDDTVEMRMARLGSLESVQMVPYSHFSMV